MKTRDLSNEEKYLLLLGALNAAWTAYEAGAPAAPCFEGLWRFYQKRLVGEDNRRGRQ